MRHKYNKVMAESCRLFYLGDCMKPYAEQFYKSKSWQDTRRAYYQSKGGLCERCIQNGLYTHGDIVHHKVHITPNNINDPSITLDFNNLELLCRNCHADEHIRKGNRKRYKINFDGSLTLL